MEKLLSVSGLIALIGISRWDRATSMWSRKAKAWSRMCSRRRKYTGRSSHYQDDRCSHMWQQAFSSFPWSSHLCKRKSWTVENRLNRFNCTKDHFTQVFFLVITISENNKPWAVVTLFGCYLRCHHGRPGFEVRPSSCPRIQQFHPGLTSNLQRRSCEK